VYPRAPGPFWVGASSYLAFENGDIFACAEHIEKGGFRMTKEEMSRREAVDRLTRLVAMAAGMSLTEVSQLLGAGSHPQSVKQAQKVQQLQATASNEIKALKVLVSGKKSVFEAEFGGMSRPRSAGGIARVTRPVQAGRTCGEDYQDGGSCTDLSCDIHGCSPEGEGSCNDINVCSDQSCSNQGTCKENTCVDQTCDKQNCDKNNQQILTEDFLDRFKNDPFVQDLFKDYNVTTSSDLAAQLRTMVKQRRRELTPIRK
jgi:hypothetical protein